ncbi:MAG: M67 family metallopeptidase [Dethiobacteria bacterium]|nr:M67 family metallopeptidase [Bacillota bacterium]MDW7729333.1 M67 family metallopeptidase [Bacillota bacterium]
MQTNEILIPGVMNDEMIRHARGELPYEACGIIAGVAGKKAVKFYPARNELKSETRYNIAPEDLYSILMELEKKGLDVWGIFHSHPSSPAYPSATDIKQSYYPDSYYLIVSFLNPNKPELRVFKIDGEEVAEMVVIICQP